MLVLPLGYWAASVQVKKENTEVDAEEIAPNVRHILDTDTVAGTMVTDTYMVVCLEGTEADEDLYDCRYPCHSVSIRSLSDFQPEAVKKGLKGQLYTSLF